MNWNVEDSATEIEKNH